MSQGGLHLTDRLAIVFRAVDRAQFCLDDQGNQLHQTSAPEVIARMLRALDVKTGSRVLEIGAGSGYSSALLAELVGSGGMVVTIDVDPPISDAQGHCCPERGTRMCTSQPRMADSAGHVPLPTIAPWPRVFVSVVPQAWLAQSRPDAILLIPVRSGAQSWICKYRRSADGRAVEEERFAAGFLPATATPFRPWEHPGDRSDQP